MTVTTIPMKGGRQHPVAAIPEGGAYRIVNARVLADITPALRDRGDEHRLADCEIVIDGGRIAALGAPGSIAGTADLPAVDLRNGLALPRFVDIHTHLDKGHIWPRTPNPNGTPQGARGAVLGDREKRWVAEDVRTRMDFALRCAYAHGTGAIRTHIDSLGKQAAISWPVFAEMREAWKDRIALQAVALVPVELAVDDEPQFRALVDIVARHHGILGGVTYLGEAPTPKLDLALDRAFAAAQANGLDVDFHVDESCSLDARSLERIAVAALRNTFTGKVLAGHCCSLSLIPDDDRARTIERLAEAGVAIVSLPMVNMYLQDRGERRTPRLRGVAPLHELDAGGVQVMIASDNTRDPYHAYGDLDMIEVFREGTRIIHFDHSDRPWARMFGAAAAEVMRLAGRGLIAADAPADLVLTQARTLHELICRPQSDRVVLVNGRAIDTALPDYRELDHLYVIEKAVQKLASG